MYLYEVNFTRIMRLFLVFSILPYFVSAQILYQTNRNDSIKVFENNLLLQNPWAGGLNSVQASEIDLNNDGIKDLFVFDRCGNKITTYLNNGAPNSTDYRYSANYKDSFPTLENWVLLRDYNCDGKEDIFTNFSGGIRVYKNTSVGNNLSFQLVKNQITSYYNPNNLGIYVTSTDIPSINDIDGDGDLDILTFEVLGSSLEYHKNLSMEIYGNCDSLKFELKNPCWGKFTENPNNCSVNLNSCTPPPNSERVMQGDKHAGSSILALETNGNTAKEIVLGDISCNNLTLLENGGTLPNQNSAMISADNSFPKNNSNTVKAEMSIFPAAFLLDLNNNGKKDLLVSPNIYGSNATENFNSIWHYQNTGTNITPEFILQEKNFLQNTMIELGDAAYPTLADVDADGLTDLIIGNYNYYDSTGGTLAFFKNTGTNNMPQFTLITRNFANIKSYNLSTSNLPSMAIAPTFGDLDNDGDPDMIIGDLDGNIHYFQNNGGVFTLSQPFYFSIDVGQFATPQLFDLNGDSLLDLVIGERNGNLNYYQNTGSKNSPVFTFVTDSLGKVNTTPWWDYIGFSYPYFFKLNGSTHLLCGSKSGHLYYYIDIDNKLTGSFYKVDSTFMHIQEGFRTSVCGADLIGNDGIPEIVVGNLAGGVNFYEGSTILSSRFQIAELHDYVVFPVPASSTISIKYNTYYFNNGIINYTISDLSGKEIQNGNLNSNNVISVTELSSGTYFLTLRYNSLPIFKTKKITLIR